MSPASTDDESVAYARWQQGVAGVLAKSRRIEPSELGTEPQKLLDTITYDGVTVAPLYSPRDELPESPLPGTYPFVRGGSKTRDVNAGWHVATVFGDGTAVPSDVNTALLDSLQNGVGAIWLRHSTSARLDDTSSLDTILDGVYLDLAPITLDAGSRAAEAAEALYAVLDSRAAAGDGVTDRSAVRVQLGAAPLTSAYSSTDDVDLDSASSLAAAASERAETVRAITVDGTVFHNRGASDSEELGAAAAAGLEYLRALTSHGMTISDALDQIAFRLSATDDQFQTIAKFRAARVVWARIAQACGAPEAGNAPQHAITSAAMMAQRDPWVNMLRTTLAAFGAGVGGADVVTVLPFDSALPDGTLAISKSFAARIARNTQLLLLEESHLGRVMDPAAGSWYVEDLTAEIAAKAWEFFQEIEAAGGFADATATITDRFAATRAARDRDIAHRKTTVTGVNEFPNLGEAPLPVGAADHDSSVHRYAAAYERLRDRSDEYLAAHGARPKVLLIPLGPVAEHNVRTTFGTNLLAAGGIEAVDPGPLQVGTGEIAAAVTAADSPIALLCGTDKRYGEEAAAAVEELRSTTIGTVLLAGPEGAFADVEPDKRPDGFVTAKIDAVAVLSELLDIITGSAK
ncbi:methylmalonyl-CoA mutase family protein [Rhodococcus sp. NPDC058521]|uniref:methylmalonyl-CoA mutase family protein n=1 Tax=Rhodococcus sp. NPDC058521 TaxID=3346536 RepID=UPI00364EA81F